MPSNIHKKLFLANVKAGAWADAAFLFKELSTTVPDSVQVAWNALFQSQRELAYLSFLIDRQPADNLWVERGQLYLATGNHLRAYDDFTAALKENPQHPLANYYIGGMEFEFMGNAEMAMRYLNRAIQGDDSLVEAYRLRAKVFEHFGNGRAAKKDRERAARALQ